MKSSKIETPVSNPTAHQAPANLCAQDTIAAIATPLGEGALGIVRISGPGAMDVAQKIFVHGRRQPLSTQRSYTLRHGWIIHGGQKIDEVLLAVYRSPASYTGEDTVEITGHGGYATVRSILSAALDCGARLADPGEFTKRAFLNGKMDLAQAEAVMDLIQAKSEQSLRAGLARLRGGLSQWIGQLREEILAVYGPLEAAIDFPEEDIEDIGMEQLVYRIQNASEKVAALLSSTRGARLARGGIKVAIIGQPNAGKSSLFNALLLEKRALVTEVPGTTRDVIHETIVHKGVLLNLADTAGLRTSKRRVESEGIALSLEQCRQADIVLYLIDRSKVMNQRDKEFIASNIRVDNGLVVLSKIDLPGKISRLAQEQLAGKIGVCCVSAVTGQGLEDLKDKIIGLIAASVENLGASDETQSANTRQIEILIKTREALEKTLESCRKGQSYEMIVADLRRGLYLLGQITGETVTGELLQTIFARFCIGK